MKEYSGLDKLRSSGGDATYCPSCDNYLEVVSNGFFHGQLFYCPKEKKVFGVYLKDLTNKAGKDYLEQCQQDMEIKRIRRMVDGSNYKKVEDLLTSPK